MRKFDYTASINSTEPIMPSQIPHVRIDCRGLIQYADAAGKTVMELSDEEKDKFISGSTMRELRKSWS